MGPTASQCRDPVEVRLFPNSRRPGIGLRPRTEAQRPLLSQHARHCPVLEAGSATGFLIHAPLAENESFYVSYEGEGRYRFAYALSATAGKWEPIFSVAFQLPIGGVGTIKEEVTMGVPSTQESRNLALLTARMFIAVDDLGTPAGAVTLRGAWSFQTPPGWDTLYTPIFNMIERPAAPMLVVRVETDWYPHDSEFRYVLQPGEGFSASHGMPIGQVLFVPRETVVFRDGTEEEIAARRTAKEAFHREKNAVTQKTPYGLEYSPHYLRTSRLHHAGVASSGDRALDVMPRAASAPPASVHSSVAAAGAVPEPPPVPKVGRNAPCPCGSGFKFKKCHGAA